MASVEVKFMIYEIRLSCDKSELAEAILVWPSPKSQAYCTLDWPDSMFLVKCCVGQLSVYFIRNRLAV